MAMISLREGAWIHRHGCRWAFERRCGPMTEWRAQDGSLRHVQLTDREIASGIGAREIVLHDGLGRSPAITVNATSRAAPPSSADLEEAKRKLEYVLEVHERRLLTGEATPADWEAAIDHVHRTVGSTWTRLRGDRRGEPLDKPSLKSVRRWTADGGKRPTVDRLVSRHRHKGNRTDRIESAVRAVIEQQIDEHWLVRPAIRLDDLKTRIQTRVTQLNEALPPGETPYRLPGDDAILTSISALPPERVLAARHGKMAAFLKFGSAEALKDPDAPLDVVELDSTPADLFVVCHRTRLPLGRPTVVICIDRCTRMVLGWFVTFEKPSILSVMQTLRNAIMPKDYVRRMNDEAGWGIRHDCETFGVPRELKVDRGLENLTTHVRDLAVRIGILRVRTLARKSPWLKGCVERTIRTMSERVFHPAKGTSLHNALARMDYDPATDAVCTTADLDWALHKYFIDVYPREKRRSLANKRAIDVWRDLCERFPVDFPSSAGEVDHLFGRTDTAVPGRHGIRAHSMSYYSRELLALLDDPAFVKALKREGGRLTYHLDPADLGQIVVELPHERRSIVVPVARKWRDYATGLSLFAHRKIREYTTTQSRDANDADDLLACKAELLGIMQGSFGRGRIGDRQLSARIEGSTTMARAGDDVRTSASPPPTVPASVPNAPARKPPAPTAVPLRVVNGPTPAPRPPAEPDAAADMDNVRAIAPARVKKGFRP